jgi:hypothetical protein
MKGATTENRSGRQMGKRKVSNQLKSRGGEGSGTRDLEPLRNFTLFRACLAFSR